jgi:hypothetical protein
VTDRISCNGENGVSLCGHNVKNDTMTFGVTRDCSSRRFLKQANGKLQSPIGLLWQAGDTMNCLSLHRAVAVASFDLLLVQ